MKNYKEKNCNHCNKVFKPTGPNRKSCSIECAVLHNLKKDTNNCHNWNGYKDVDGYGTVTWKSKLYKTHRVMCKSVHGPAPEDKPFVCHSCDNPSCCNPEHLRWGTQQENMNDKIERGRSAKGSENGNSTLKEKQVTEIITELKTYRYGDYQRLATKYNVSITLIRKIHKNKIWTHLER